MDQENSIQGIKILELFEDCERLEKKIQALKILSDWLPLDVIADIEKKIEEFKKKNNVFITKKFRSQEAHKTLLPFLYSAKNRALEKIREMGIIKDEDNAFRCP